jgi:hypothetical protein
MRLLLLAAVLLLPARVFAQSPDGPSGPKMALSSELQHAIDFLERGGTYNEGRMLGTELARQFQTAVDAYKRELAAAESAKAMLVAPPPPAPAHPSTESAAH